MKLTLYVLGFIFMIGTTSQDLTTAIDGDEIADLYASEKSEMTMIKHENGVMDAITMDHLPGVADDTFATIYFYRPKKFANSATKIIVGTVEPDEVIVSIKNGSWFKKEYHHLGERQFVTGVFKINPKTYQFNIEAGETYYFKCTVLTKGLKVMAEMEIVEEMVAEKEMAKLKEQSKDYVD